jgi:4'-phosphopantetheinyl transferase
VLGRPGVCLGEIMSAYGCMPVSRLVRDVDAGLSDGGRLARPPFRASASCVDDVMADPAVEVVVTRLDVVPDIVLASAALLSDAERQRASRFAFDRERRRFVVARARLRQLLGARLHVRPDAVELVYGKRGKPALAGRFADSGLRFNLSHCDDVALYAFSHGREIGVDIEAVRMVPDADVIAARMFSRGENEVYRTLDPRDKPLGFFNCWTRKEAFIKALGDGLYYPLDRFDVSLAPDEPARILRVESTTGDQCGWTLHRFWPGPGLIGAIVVQQVTRESASPVGSERIVRDSLAPWLSPRHDT